MRYTDAMTPGALLAQARRRAGLTQAELAARAGTSQAAISDYERGRRDPSVTTLRRLLKAAGARLELRAARVGPADDELPPPAGDEERAARLVDVLLLSDAVPRSRRPRSRYPRFTSV